MEGLAAHVSREHRPADRGRAFGRSRADAVGLTVATYRRLFADAAALGRDEVLRLGERVGNEVAAELVDEIEGIAAGAGHDPRELLAINARTELLAGTQARGECSLLARGRPGGAWLAQTWDWHPDLAGAAIAWTIEHGSGRFTTITEAGVLAKLGLNDAGIACGLNFLTCSEDRRSGGVPIHLLLRLVLERCADGAQARALLCGARTAASSCITVAAGSGELFAAELSPGGTRIVEPDADGWLVHTNHFLRPPAAGTDPTPRTHPGTLERRLRLSDAAHAGVAPGEALAQHGGRLESVCRHDHAEVAWHERRATLLAVWAEPARDTLRVAAGPPCQVPFELVA